MNVIKDSELSIHNKYTLKLCDAAGNIKEERVAYNVANSSRYMARCLEADWPGYTYTAPSGSITDSSLRMDEITTIVLGSGTEPEPSVEDDHLIAINTKFSQTIKFTRVNIPEKYGDKVHFTASVTYPPSSSYTGTLTEIGLSTSGHSTSEKASGWVFSHAWISDIEGTKMPITKTAMDKLVITVDVYFTLSLPSSQADFAKHFPVWATPIVDTLPGLAGRIVFLSAGYMPPVNGTVCVSAPNTTCRMPETNDDRTIKGSAGYLCTNEDGTQSSNITTRISNKAFEPADNNIGYVHSIIIDRHAVIALPNSSICPNYTYNDIAIGTGDGSTTRFYTPVNQVVSSKIYVDGVEDTTAKLISADVTLSPFWDKCIGVYACDYVSSSAFTQWHELPEVGGTTPIAMSSQLFAATTQYSRFAPCGHRYSTAGYQTSWSAGTAPVYYDAAGIWCDHVYLGALVGEGHYQDLVIQYSNDAISDFLAYDSSWTTLTTVTYVGNPMSVYFTRTKAKYWRIKGFLYGSKYARISSIEASWAGGSKGYDPCCLILGDSTVHDFGKIGVNFTTAPASGAAITMDAVLNLPFKSPDTRIDLSYEAFIHV